MLFRGKACLVGSLCARHLWGMTQELLPTGAKRWTFRAPKGVGRPRVQTVSSSVFGGVRVKGTVMLTTFFPWAGELSVPRHPARERRQCA